MKFEREKDIPAFLNKTAKERRALRREAIRRDPAIMWVSAVGGALMFIWLPISYDHRTFRDKAALDLNFVGSCEPRGNQSVISLPFLLFHPAKRLEIHSVRIETFGA